jgi:tRNA threonylcarbamoyladenosine biosynthesis protein TsaB
VPLPDGVILGVEISNPSARDAHAAWAPGVALARLAQGTLTPIAEEPLAAADPHDDDLLPSIARLVARSGLRPRDLAAIAVSVGPGGFTALRISTAAGAMLAEATGAACVGVPSAHVVARRVHADTPFAVALASKGDSAWVQPFDARAAPTAPGRLLHAPDLASLAVPLLVADHYLPEPFRAEAARLRIDIRPPVFSALACIEAALSLDPVDPARLLPLYPREPEAVTKWRALKARNADHASQGP